MKKNIFFAGEVRLYNSADPKPFCDGIRDYIKQNILLPDNQVDFEVTVTENATKEITVEILLLTGEDITPGSINQDLYCMLSGEYRGFRAEYSLLFSFNFGPMYKPIYYLCADDIVAYHKKNTRFYKANRYKSMSIEESLRGLTVKFQF